MQYYAFEKSLWCQKLRFSALVSNLRDRVLGEVEKDSFIALPGKGGHSRLLPQKTMCPNPREFDEGFYNSGSRVGSLTRLRYVQGLPSFHLSQMVSGGLLILRRVSGPFNLASGGFLAAPPLISNCSHQPFGTQRRSWRLESCLQELGDKKRLLCLGAPQGPVSYTRGNEKSEYEISMLARPYHSFPPTSMYPLGHGHWNGAQVYSHWIHGLRIQSKQC